jgi:hypothetical protein
MECVEVRALPTPFGSGAPQFALRSRTATEATRSPTLSWGTDHRAPRGRSTWEGLSEEVRRRLQRSSLVAGLWSHGLLTASTRIANPRHDRPVAGWRVVISVPRSFPSVDPSRLNVPGSAHVRGPVETV